MKITLDVRKSALENARALFDEAKKYRRKAEGARKAIEVTRLKISRLEAANASSGAGGTEKTKPGPGARGGAGAGKGRGKGKRRWFGEYRYFTTTNGLLCVGGKNAKQNDLLVASQLKDGDLFFHADVHGASAVVLKEGASGKAKEQDLSEAAQFAACYSNAWKGGTGTADVYSVGKDQVSKHSHGEYVGKGAFLIAGERNWFKNTRLEIALVKEGDGLFALPAEHAKAKNCIKIVPGAKTKEELFSLLKAKLGLKKTNKDEFAALLPGNGETA